MGSRFLFNVALWDELSSRIPKATTVRAAVAYLGTGASRLLPLRRGDKLVVDMSLRAVRSGTTDPREVQRFLRRGVQVFSRGSLHAKFFVIDRTVIAGSANISGHARNSLDEAAVMTDDGAAVRRALATFELLCTEPVRKNYLDKCIAEYRPPKFVPGERPPGSRRKKSEGRVWLIGGLRYRDLPEREQDDADAALKRASKRLMDFERSKVECTHYPKKLAFFSRLRLGFRPHAALFGAARSRFPDDVAS
jgi:phosphatidylserine/phosphatidylglycerophosphate/cardiolipin synthase-like enzyme